MLLYPGKVKFQKERAVKSRAGRKEGFPPLVVVVGEMGETGVQVAQTLLGKLSGVAERLILVVARRTKFPRLDADIDILAECEYFKSSARVAGVEVEIRLVSGRAPVVSMARECEALAAAHPGALFCFIEWGCEEVARALAAKGLKTVRLVELLGSEGAEFEASV